MIPKVAYILAAGLGTRMGPEGAKVPKPLWPIYNKTLVEIVAHQVRELGVEKIYLNSHHLHQMMNEYIAQKKLDLEVLYEKELLGSGGCFSHLKSVIGNQRVLSLNADSFFLISKEQFENEANRYQRGHVLFARKVAANSNYNGFEFNEDQLTGIRKPPFDQAYWTFSGVSIVDLALVDEPIHPFSFFEKVVIPGEPNSRISFINCDFYDFGTLDEYCKTCGEVERQASLSEFLARAGVIISHDGNGENKFRLVSDKKKIAVSFNVLGQDVSVSTSF